MGLCLWLGTANSQDIRVATFNASLNRGSAGHLLRDLSQPETSGARQIKRVAEIIQKVRPDILLLNEFDHDEEGEGMKLFQENFLSVGQGGQDSIIYKHRFTAPSNTGVSSGQDFDNSGRAATNPGNNSYAGDAFGFGTFPGQYGMVVYSQFPIKDALLRNFQKFLWKDMPNSLLPNGEGGRPAYYNEEESAIFRLSSESHWDLPIEVNGEFLHLLVSHPTPPVFDGAEDRNGRRNHDEIRLWKDYLMPDVGTYIYDDSGLAGGLAENERFVIMGDLNADPSDGDSSNGAIAQLLDHPRVQATPTPTGPGGTEAANRQHRGNPAEDTAGFSRENLRADYVLPSIAGLTVRDAKVFWPKRSDPLSASVRGASDHRLVYLELTLTPAAPPTVSRLRIERNTTTALLHWQGQPDTIYSVHWTQDLHAPWREDPAITLEANDGNVWLATDTTSTRRRFYRVQAINSP
jgi:endonuclease/exonuclease/phosphatase family metal-dependent hydrolase